LGFWRLHPTFMRAVAPPGSDAAPRG
jgi:hypothetical protein